MKHLLYIILVLPLWMAEAATRQDKQSDLPGLKPLLFIIERVLDNQAAAQKQSQRLIEPSSPQPIEVQRQHQPQVVQKVPAIATEKLQEMKHGRANENLLSQDNLVQYGGVFAFNQGVVQSQGHNAPRAGNQVFLLGYPGQEQPVLVNPGYTPGNFLPQQPQPQPGPNVIFRYDQPQPPAFGAYPSRPSANQPPFEKDAETIPTDPAKIPPMAILHPTAKKPEKLISNRTETRTAVEAEVLEAADRHHQYNLPGGSINPGQRFFILNGQSLYSNNLQNGLYPDLSRTGSRFASQGFQQPNVPQKHQRYEPFIQNLQDNYRLSDGDSQSALFLNQPANSAVVQPKQNTIQQNQAQLSHLQVPQQQVQIDTLPRVHFGEDIFQRQYQPDAIPRTSQGFNDLSYPFFRNNLIHNGANQNANINQQQELLFNPSYSVNGGQENGYPTGQFRFNAPGGPFYPLGGDDVGNDSIVVDAQVEGDASNANSDIANKEGAAKSKDPSTAQASPGAIAVAGPGGVAGASPRATALVGKGGLAVSSPRATAVAGNREDEKISKGRNRTK